MKQVNYRQCGLTQNGSRVIGWIEERGAKVGARVEIDELGGLWEVTNVGEGQRSKSEVHEAENRARKPFSSLAAYRSKD
jgi:hypothetical protein